MKPGSEDYPASQHYQLPEVADVYDARRFRSPLGRLGDLLEKRALLRMLREIPNRTVVLE